jgi:hypothetical protein
VVRNGTEWKLKVNGKDADVTPKDDDDDDDDDNTDTGSGNVWQRFNSPKGYQTDLAIGGIKGEPATRVYMCEHPGSPSAGLYKGTINGTVITWDAVHGLPNAKFYERDGVMRLWFTVGPEDDAGRYKKGTWTSTCGKLENSSRKIVVAYKKADTPEFSISSVKIENINCPITQLTASVTTPECSTNKFIMTPATSANADYYTVSITYSAEGINGPYNQNGSQTSL